jgi:hypothetical protein
MDKGPRQNEASLPSRNDGESEGKDGNNSGQIVAKMTRMHAGKSPTRF